MFGLTNQRVFVMLHIISLAFDNTTEQTKSTWNTYHIDTPEKQITQD